MNSSHPGRTVNIPHAGNADTAYAVPMPQAFYLRREHDVSGVSGVGIVAEGVRFSDGTCVVRWLSERRSTVVWSSIADVEAIHGHDGATQIVWVD